MKTRSAFVLFSLFLFGCGPGDPKDTHFKGTWRHVQENSIANTKEEERVTATVDHDRFRLERTIGASQIIDVFDGKTLFRKSVYTSADTPFPPSESSQPATVTQTGSERFWTGYQQGHSGPGGLVAGRDTLLYQISNHRTDGDLGAQEWIDAKTGILLKSSSSIYSSQARMMVRQESWECESITYDPVDESAFQKP